MNLEVSLALILGHGPILAPDPSRAPSDVRSLRGFVISSDSVNGTALFHEVRSGLSLRLKCTPDQLIDIAWSKPVVDVTVDGSRIIEIGKRAA